MFASHAIGIVLGLHCTIANGGDRKPVAAPKPPVRLDITISKATTYFTKPVRRDGTVDYLEALNRHYSTGVTASNNAVVPILRAFGPRDIPKGLRAEVFRRLGMRPLPAEGKYYAIPDFGRGPRGKSAKKRWLSQFERASGRPWKNKECPLIAKWLQSQSEVMKLIEKAARRPAIYLPIATSEPTRLVVNGLDLRLPFFQHVRASARIFAIRANLHIANGKVDAARRDLMTIHLLARILDRDGFLISPLVAYAVDQVASSGDWELAKSGKLTAKQAIDYRKNLDRIGPLNSLSSTLDVGERCYALDNILFFVRAAARSVNELKALDEYLPRKLPQTLKGRFEAYFDIDTMLKLVNQRFDEFVKVAAINDPFRRRTEAAELKAEMEMRMKRLKRVPGFLRSPPSDRKQRAAASRWLAEIMMGFVQPAVAQVLDVEDQTNVLFDLARVALSLAAYRADNGDYPATLAKLKPKYARGIPLDRFSGKPLIYKRIKGGFLLYSVGQNGKDDGGRGYEDNDVDTDDLHVRVPRWPVSKPMARDRD